MRFGIHPHPHLRFGTPARCKGAGLLGVGLCAAMLPGPAPAAARSAIPASFNLGMATSLDLSKAPTPRLVIGRREPGELPLGVSVCAVSGAPWATVGADGRSLLLTEGFRDHLAWLRVETAADPAPSANPTPSLGESNDARSACATQPHRTVQLLLYPKPQWQDGTGAAATLYSESRVAEVTAANLEGATLVAVRAGTVVASAPCLAKRSCSLPLDLQFMRALASIHRDAQLLLWPATVSLTHGEPLPLVLEQGDRWRGPNELAIHKPRFEFSRPLITQTELNAEKSHITLPLEIPEAVADVRCERARCSLGDSGIDVYAIDPDTLSVGLQLLLRPGVVRTANGRRRTREDVNLDVVRCGLRVPEDLPLLANAVDHRYFVAVARSCFTGDARQLSVETWPPTYAYVKAEVTSTDAAWRMFEVVLEKVPREHRHIELRLTRAQPARTTLGAVRLPVAADYMPVTLILDVPELGVVRFIPGNRYARVRLAFEAPRWKQSIQVVGRAGYYGVTHPGDETRIRAAQGAAGSIPLRLAYKPPALERFLGRPELLATVDTDGVYPIRPINVPLPLDGRAGDDSSYVHVRCRQRGAVLQLSPGVTESIPFPERNSCSVLIDRQKIPEWAGEQRLRLNSPAGLNQILTVDHRPGTLAVSLSAEGKREFDTLSLSIGHEYGGGHYDFSPQHNIGAESNYQVVLGDRSFRISAGTTLPTGLFRFGAKSDRGAVPFSAGAVARVVWLYKEGREFPIGLEVGMLGTGLSDDPHFSVVSGLGFSVPVLNPNTPLQTSFNLHAWIEYSPTRTGKDERQWAFLFGPSFAVGKFSTNL